MPISAILIAGPTASGKSATAIRLAEILNGAVINADSMQVYEDLRVLTARPGAQEMMRAPHLLFGHVDGMVNYSVALWLGDAEAAIHSAQVAGRLPILTGGTGLYFKALTQGLSEIPSVPHALRAALRERSRDMTSAALYAELARADVETAARLRPSDRQRVLRALEVFEATGRPLVRFQAKRAQPVLDPERTVSLFVAPDRARLTARINARFDAMLDAGAVEEVRRLADRRLDPALPVMRAHGVPGLIAYLRGEATLAEAADQGKADTRRYAKRQFTWARSQLRGFRWIAPELAVSEVLSLVSVERTAFGKMQ